MVYNLLQLKQDFPVDRLQFMHQYYLPSSRKECGASIACQAIKSGAGCPVQRNDCLIPLSYYDAIRMWAYTETVKDTCYV